MDDTELRNLFAEAFDMLWILTKEKFGNKSVKRLYVRSPELWEIRFEKNGVAGEIMIEETLEIDIRDKKDYLSLTLSAPLHGAIEMQIPKDGMWDFRFNDKGIFLNDAAGNSKVEILLHRGE